MPAASDHQHGISSLLVNLDFYFFKFVNISLPLPRRKWRTRRQHPLLPECVINKNGIQDIIGWLPLDNRRTSASNLVSFKMWREDGFAELYANFPLSSSPFGQDGLGDCTHLKTRRLSLSSEIHADASFTSQVDCKVVTGPMKDSSWLCCARVEHLSPCFRGLVMKWEKECVWE